MNWWYDKEDTFIGNVRLWIGVIFMTLFMIKPWRKA